MASSEAKLSRAALIRLCLILSGCSFLLLLWACNLAGEKKVEHTLSFAKLYDSLSRYEKVVIVVKDPDGAWVDTVFTGKVDSRAAIENLKSPHFQGSKVEIEVIGFTGGIVAYKVEKDYDGTTGKTDGTVLVVSGSTTLVSGSASLQIKEGEVGAIPSITVKPDDLADKSLHWTSSDSTIFTVSGIEILARRPGAAILRARLNSDPSKGVDIAVTVTAKNTPVDTSVKRPAAPTIESLIGGDTKVTIHWNTVVGAESYNIFYGEGGSVDRASTRIKGVTSPFEVGGLRNGALYAFALTAVNATGESDLGAAQIAMPQLPAASAPVITSVVAGDGKVTLVWGSVAGSLGYALYYTGGSTVDKQGTKVAPVSSPHVLTGLSANTQYAFAVATQTAGGESGLSNITTAKTFPPAPSNLAYAVNPAVYFAGVSIIENPATVTGMVDSFSVSPSLPAGLILNRATGAVTGTPTGPAAAAGYEVTALNQTGSTKAILNITVNGAPTGLVYAQNPATYWKGVAIGSNTATVSGVVDSFTIAPALPSGLALNRATGAITGTPLAASAAESFTVTAHSRAGSFTAPLAITVNGAPFNLAYSQNPAAYFQTIAITANNALVNGLVDSFTVAPALPAGLSLNRATGAITGTPIAPAASAQYSVTAWNPAGTATVNLSLAVNGTPTGLVYTQNPATYWRGVAIGTNTATVSGVVDSFTISPALPSGLSLNRSTGAVTGTPVAATATAFYTVTAHNRAGNSTVPLAIAVNGAPSNLAYSLNPAAYFQTVAITANTVAVNGLVDSFTVAPALPAGLSLNRATGTIIGTPTAVAASAQYTVTAWNPAGTATVNLALTVNGAPSGLTYSANPATYWQTQAITANTASVSGVVDSFTVSPALPAGLSLNKTTGAVTGTPTAPAASAAYTVTARNRAGTATVQLTILVNGPPSGLTYATNPATYWTSSPITTNSATVSGMVDSFTVSPALPAGLALNRTNGAITGTPTAATASAVYTVRAWNRAGSTTAGVTLIVNGPPSGLAYSTNPATYVRGNPILQNTASVSGIVDSFTVSSALPAGLALSKATGAITGNPTVITARAAYTIRAWNKAGTSTVSLSLAITGSNSTITLEVAKDGALDTTSNDWNTGYTGVTMFGYMPSEHVFTIFQWDLGAVSTTGLISAKAVFKTYAYGTEWGSGPRTFTVRLYRIQSAWEEGTGNWYRHRDDWQNDGENLYSNYNPPYPEYVRTGSTDPALPTGVTNGDRDLIKRENLIEMSTQSITLNYSGASIIPAWGPPFPASANLVDVEIDLTEYVLAVAGGTDYGLVIMLDGSAPTRQVNLMTKEISDGTLGAKLHLNY